MNQNRDSITSSDGMWDVIDGVRSWRLWAYMGLIDIRQRYRRSVLGPLWMALGLGMTVLGIGLLYTQVFNATADTYLPYIAISFLVWNLVTSVLTEGTTLIGNSSAIISAIRLPFTSLVLRSIVRNLIVAAHGLIVVVLTFVWFRVPVSLESIFSILGVVLIVVNLYWMTIIIMLISARYRDVAQIFNYLIGFMFFITPIIWMPSQVRPGSAYLMYNPFAYLVSVVRDPLIAGTIPWTSFAVCAAMAAVGVPLTAIIFARFRRYVPYWT